VQHSLVVVVNLSYLNHFTLQPFILVLWLLVPCLLVQSGVPIINLCTIQKQRKQLRFVRQMVLTNDLALKVNKEILIRILTVLALVLLLVLLLNDIQIDPLSNNVLVKLLIKPLDRIVYLFPSRLSQHFLSQINMLGYRLLVYVQNFVQQIFMDQLRLLVVGVLV
jgi:hypothetical protein